MLGMVSGSLTGFRQYAGQPSTVEKCLAQHVTGIKVEKSYT